MNKNFLCKLTAVTAFFLILSVLLTGVAINKTDAQSTSVKQVPGKSHSLSADRAHAATTGAGHTAVTAPPEKVTQKEVAYITSLNIKNGKLYGTFDYIQWFLGKGADEQVKKECGCNQGAPDGYFIRNDNPKLRQLPISATAEYVLQTRDPYTINWNEKVTESEFIKFANSKEHLSYTPYHLVIENGIVTKITEQFIP